MYHADAWRMLRRRRSRPAPTGDVYPQASRLPASSLSTEISSKSKSPLPTVSYGPRISVVTLLTTLQMHCAVGAVARLRRVTTISQASSLPASSLPNRNIIQNPH